MTSPYSPGTPDAHGGVSQTSQGLTDTSWATDPQHLPRRDGGHESMPRWVAEYRNHQVQAVEQVIDAIEAGNRVIVLSAPTGSGKTLIAETVRRMLGWRGVYVCSTKTLQDQVVSDFPYAQLLKGRRNYPTADHPEKFHAQAYGQRITAADCDKHPIAIDTDDQPIDGSFAVASAHSDMECSWCTAISSCPYEQAKHEALKAPLAVLNTSYLLTEANYLGVNAGFTGLPFVVADEADLLESELLGALSVSVPHAIRKRLGLGVPDRKTKPEAWARWVREIVPKLYRAIAKLPENGSLEQHRERQNLSRLAKRLGDLAAELEAGSWVYTGSESTACVFKPIHVGSYGNQWLWRHADIWLLMSATVIAPDEMMRSLGGLDLPWTTVNVPSTFPVEKRPIRVIPTADMTHKTKDTGYPLMAKAVGKVIANHPNERILVHTVSYELATYLMLHLDTDRTLTYANSDEREPVLRDYLLQPAAVLIAPSMERGIDLEGDDCRVIVVCKLPYPNLGDKQVSARLYSSGGQLWYAAESIRALVQMTGRGVRNENDHCVTYILDRQFVTNIWKKSKRYLPQWWTDALVWDAGPLR